MNEHSAPTGFVGQSIERVEDAGLLTGRGRYIDDLATRRDTAHAAFLRSPHAHAEIRRLDTDRAKVLPGVLAVITGDDIARLTHSLVVGVKADVECWPMARDRVRYVGEPVVLVVAENRYAAEDADVSFLDPELLLPFHRTEAGSYLAFDRSAAPVSDTWPIVDYDLETGERRLIHRTFDGWCRLCVAEWTAPDYTEEFTVEKYLLQGERHASIEPDVSIAHVTVAHANRRAGEPEKALESYLKACRSFEERTRQEGRSRESIDAVVQHVLRRRIRDDPSSALRLQRLLSTEEYARWLSASAVDLGRGRN